MNIVGIFPVPEIRTGGHKRYLELTRGLLERGHNVFQVCRPALAGNLPGTPIPIIPDSIRAFVPPRWMQYKGAVRNGRQMILEAIRGRRGTGTETVVVTFGETNYVAAQTVARLLSVPLLFALRSNFVDEFIQFGGFRRRLPGFVWFERQFAAWWKRRLERAITCGSDVVVFQTDYDRDNVAGRCSWVTEKARVIPNSMRASWIPESSALTNRSTSLRRAIYLGNLGERKGVQYLFPALREVGPRLHVDVIGFGGLEEWARAYVRDNGMDAWVTFHGRVDEPLDALAAADLLIVPSLYDSFPNTVLEALFVGTPVIGADAAGIRTMLVHDELLFPKADSDALARRLGELIDNNAAYKRVCELCTGRRSVFDFDWAERWEGVIKELMKRNGESG